MHAATNMVEGNAKVPVLYMALELSDKKATLSVRRTLIVHLLKGLSGRW